MSRKRTNYDITIPTDWEQITLKRFIEIKKLYDQYDNNVPVDKLIEFLANKDDGYLRDCPALIVTKIVEKLSFLKTPLTDQESDSITINDETYRINTEDELKFGEFTDAQMILAADADDFPSLLAVICRKENEIYDDEYIAKKFKQRKKMFENQPMTNIQPLLNFFFQRLIVSNLCSQSYLVEMIDQTNHILEHYSNLPRNGIGNALSTWWQRRKLKTLKKQLKCLQQQFLHS